MNYSKIKVSFSILFILICCMSNIFGASYIYKINNDNEKKDESSIATSVSTPVFDFESEAQVLMEASTGKILYANNEDERLLPASVTKVMTLLLIMEQIDLGKLAYTDKVTCSAHASGMGGSQIWFKENEELTIDEALKAICVVSANDVTVAMAEKIGGTETNFVNMMNEKAKSLGMVNTNFMNSHGIDEDNHYTSAKDIAIMSRELITKHPDILKYTSIWMDSLRNGEFGLSSTNKLIRFYEGANGLKTGSTSQALFNLSGTATRNGTTFISVIMRAPSSDVRLQETKQLLDFGFANYENKILYEKDTIMDTLDVSKNVSDKLDVIVNKQVSVLTEKGKNIETSENKKYNELKAPIGIGEVVGEMEIIDVSTGDIIETLDLVAKNEIKKSAFMDYLRKIFKIFIMSNQV